MLVTWNVDVVVEVEVWTLWRYISAAILRKKGETGKFRAYRNRCRGRDRLGHASCGAEPLSYGNGEVSSCSIQIIPVRKDTGMGSGSLTSP